MVPFKTKSRSTVTIVVTYNRKQSLISVIDALLKQTVTCDIIIVDNASTDGTKDMLGTKDFLNRQRISYICLPENIGGSGGFSRGLKYAMEGDWNWFWLMDDDAIPESDALENLIKYAGDPGSVYGSSAINLVGEKKKLCWPAIRNKNGRKHFVEYVDMLSEVEEVDMIPFLGLYIHRDLVERVGYPDPGFFICADDKEYCERIKNQNTKLLLIKSSIINHPLAQVVIYNFGRFQAAYRNLPPWKTYYDVRNKIFIAEKYFRYRLWTQTLPGVFLRMILSVLKEKNPRLILTLTIKAVFDGLMNRKGKMVLPPHQ
jgi:GT2 family glycosyltransferase